MSLMSRPHLERSATISTADPLMNNDGADKTTVNQDINGNVDSTRTTDNDKSGPHLRRRAPRALSHSTTLCSSTGSLKAPTTPPLISPLISKADGIKDYVGDGNDEVQPSGIIENKIMKARKTTTSFDAGSTSPRVKSPLSPHGQSDSRQSMFSRGRTQSMPMSAKNDLDGGDDVAKSRIRKMYSVGADGRDAERLTPSMELRQAESTRVYYPHLHFGVIRCGGAVCTSHVCESEIFRRNWERKEVESEDDVPLGFTTASFFIEALPVPLAILLCKYLYGTQLAKSRGLLPYNPSFDIPSLTWLMVIILYFMSSGDTVTYWMEAVMAVALLLIRATTIAFKYTTFGYNEIFHKQYGMVSEWYIRAKRDKATLMVNYAADIFGMQRQSLLEQLYSGMIRHGLDSRATKFKLEPVDAQRIWKYVKWHGEQLEEKNPNCKDCAATETDYDKSEFKSREWTRIRYKGCGWGRHMNHKFKVFGLCLFREVAGFSDECIDAMTAEGILPASILAIYIVFSSYKRQCTKKFRLIIKIMKVVTVCIAVLPWVIRYSKGLPGAGLGSCVLEIFYTCISAFLAFLTTILMISYTVGPMLEMRHRLGIATKLTDLIDRGLEIERADFACTRVLKDHCDCTECREKGCGVDVDVNDDDASPVLLNLSRPENIASWDIVRRLLHGPNFASSVYARCQFYMLTSFALECFLSLVLLEFSESSYNTFDWHIEDHPDLFVPIFIRTMVITTVIIGQVVTANSINNEAEAQAMAILRAKTCWMQESECTVPEIRKSVSLLETVHKAVEVDAVGNPVCVMYLEGNYGTIGVIFTVLGSVFYADFERICDCAMQHFGLTPRDIAP